MTLPHKKAHREPPQKYQKEKSENQRLDTCLNHHHMINYILKHDGPWKMHLPLQIMATHFRYPAVQFRGW